MKIWTILFVLLLSLVGCSNSGSEFEGKWQNIKKEEKLEIKKNGDTFLISVTEKDFFSGRMTTHDIPGTYANGAIKVSGLMGSLDLVIDKSTGMLIISGEKYRREK